MRGGVLNLLTKRKIALLITALTGATVLAGLAVVMAASQDVIARVPPAALLISGMAAFSGAIYLNATKPVIKSAESQSTLVIIVFAVLVVIALFFISAFIFPGF